MPDIALATCALLPDLDEDERLVIPALREHGLVAEARVWDDPSIDWEGFDLVVIRSAWDYAARRDAFLEWCSRMPRLLNEAPVIAWNTDKVYLRDLASAGVPIVPTTWIRADDTNSQAQVPSGHIVVKPAISSGAQHTSRYGPGDHERAIAHVDRLRREGRTVMIQPYMATVDTLGETGLIYFDGVLSHAIRKGPLLHVAGAATDELWAREDIASRDPRPDERALADVVLDALPWPREALLYARVDLVRDDDGRPLLLELELTEPSLFLGSAGAAPRLAGAIAARLRKR